MFQEKDNRIWFKYDCLICEYIHFITEFKLIEGHYKFQNLKELQFKFLILEYTRKILL